MELSKSCRPSKLSQVLGNEPIKNQLKNKTLENFPHAVLISGPSGCGKTTIARIVARRILKASSHDLKEINCASFRGIDTIRDIGSAMNLAPMGGSSRVYIVDEVHQMTTAAQDAFLKILEEAPRHVYFMLATTDPAKLIVTVRNRCTEYAVTRPASEDLMSYLQTVAQENDIEVDEDMLELIVQASECSPRKALVMLEQLDGVEASKHPSIIEAATASKTSIELARLLLSPKTKWNEVAAAIKKIEDEPEKVRRCVLGYMANVALGSNNKRAILIIEAFRDHYFDCGKAGLVSSCFEVLNP